MEEKLAEYRKKLDDVEVPMDLLDEAIEAGFERAKSEKKKKPKRIWLLSVAMVAIVLLGFSGIGKFMELIQHDKGLISAVENSYYEEMGISQKKNGVEFVIDGVIADEKGLALFHSVHTDDKQTEMSLKEATLKPLDDGEFNPSSISFGLFHHEEKGKKSFSGINEYIFQEPLTARKFQLDVEVRGNSVSEKFSIVFSLTKEIQEKKVYPLNKTIVIEGQKIHIVEAIVYPLRVAVHVEIDPNNTKKLLEIEDLRLVDEDGEVWSKVINGTSRTGISEQEFIYYLQSNYFKEPKELYLAFGKIQAVDKEYSEVIIDTEKKKILKQPLGNKLKDLEIRGGDVSMKLYTDVEFSYGLFSEVEDGKGNKIDTSSNYMSSPREEGYSTMGVEIRNLKSYQNPLALKLAFFPEWIFGDEKIRIK